MGKGYNHIFDELVGDDRDFVGIVAYTIYKRQKVEWLTRFEEEHGRPATDDEVATGFARFSNLPSQIQAYREQAIDLVDNFLDVALDEQIEEIHQEMLQNAVVKAVKRSFWSSVGENLAAGLIASLLTLGATGLIWVAAKGPENLWREALQHYMGQQGAVTPAQAPVEP